jgi:hypothetical protein
MKLLAAASEERGLALDGDFFEGFQAVGDEGGRDD